jgi:hypothetical protein
MTRHPSALKRLTVACPIPRLAPVSSKVFFILQNPSQKIRL